MAAAVAPAGRRLARHVEYLDSLFLLVESIKARRSGSVARGPGGGLARGAREVDVVAVGERAGGPKTGA